jgi:predicted ester cyclase
MVGSNQASAQFRVTFRDAHIHVEDEIAEGDRVVQRITFHGTQQGEFAGIPATGKAVAVSVVVILGFAEGKIAERWEVADELGLMQQLGAIPKPTG